MKNVPLALECLIKGPSTPRNFLSWDNIYQSVLRLDNLSNIDPLCCDEFIDSIVSCISIAQCTGTSSDKKKSNQSMLRYSLFIINTFD